MRSSLDNEIAGNNEVLIIQHHVVSIQFLDR